jgi:hypothetical protein
LASFEVRLYYDRLDGDKDLTLTPTAPPEPVWYDATDRSYVVAGLPPGKYLIAAPGIFRDIGLLASDLTLDLAVSEEASAAAPPEDPGAKPSPVRQAMRIRGRIRVDGKLPDGVALSQLNIRAGAESIEPSNNGEFSVELDPVEFSVTMPDLPPGLYLKRAELGGRDALANIMSFDPAAELEVEISSRGGYVAGIVRDSLDRLAPGADVVLIPEKADIHVEPLPGNGVSFVPRVLNTLALFKTAITDDQGQFSFAGIAPGAYRLYALEALEPFSYFDPEVLQQIESKGQPLRVTVASRETVALRLMLSGAGR